MMTKIWDAIYFFFCPRELWGAIYKGIDKATDPSELMEIFEPMPSKDRVRIRDINAEGETPKYLVVNWPKGDNDLYGAWNYIIQKGTSC